MQKVLKWLFVKPTGAWNTVFAAFSLGWSMMTQLPFLLFLGNMKIGDERLFIVDPTLHWTLFFTVEGGWFVVTWVLYSALVHVTRLYERMDVLEQDLRQVTGADRQRLATEMADQKSWN